MTPTPNLSNHVEGKTISFWSFFCGILTLTMTLSASAAENGVVFKNTSTNKVHLSNPSESQSSFKDKSVFISWTSQNVDSDEQWSGWVDDTNNSNHVRVFRASFAKKANRKTIVRMVSSISQKQKRKGLDNLPYNDIVKDGWSVGMASESVGFGNLSQSVDTSPEGNEYIDSSTLTAYLNRNSNLIGDVPVPYEYQENLVGSPDQLLGESIEQELKGNQDTLSKEGAEIDKAFYGLEGKVYYVSDTGDDSNNGRDENFPFKTLQHASDLAEPGDIVYVMSGLYQNEKDEDILGIKRSGTKSNWIMYAALPGHQPKLKVKAGDAISIHGAEYIIIDGFEIEGNNPDVSLEYALAEKNSLFNKITNSSGVKIHPDWNTTNYSHHVIVRNCHVYNFSGGGIGSNTSDYIVIENNTVHHNGYYAPWAMSGISFYRNWNFDNYQGHKMIIRNNISYANRNYVPFFYSHTDPEYRTITDGNGIIIDTNHESVKVVNGAETSIPYMGRTVIENNVSYLNGGKGINIYESDHVDVINNTAYQNSQTESLSGEINLGKADDINIYNNIVYPQINEKSISLWATGSSINVGYNMIYNTDKYFPSGTKDIIGSNPLFVNIDPQSGQYDFRLKSDSPAIDKGYELFASMVDSDGVARPVNKGYDIGAFEFVDHKMRGKKVKRRSRWNVVID
jgi:hypothetical protein